MKLWYRQPASKWEEALPIGNGRLGAMIYGGFPEEIVQLNEESVWGGTSRDRINPQALSALPEVRRLIFEGRLAEAEALARTQMGSVGGRIGAYQPLASLLIDFREAYVRQWPADYRRELDLSTGIVFVTNSWNHVYTREAFASAADGIVVVRIAAQPGGRITLRCRLDRDQDVAACRTDGLRLVLEGQLGTDGVRFRCEAVVQVDGGTVEAHGNAIHVRMADAVTFLIAGATSYVGPTDLSADPAKRCGDALGAAAARPYAELRDRHVREHRRLFDRVALDLGSSELPTDERLRACAAGASDPGLAALYFQYGRYLLMSCSRPGSLPANLQGIWNERLDPPWESDYHTNINLQMNYWPANVGNLAECQEALFDWMDAIRPSGAATARRMYGCDGWLVHHVSDPFANTAPMGKLEGIWPMGGAWLCLHIWEHFLFTGDVSFLRRQGWPLMQGAVAFLLDFLVEAPAGSPVAGRLVTNPSHSPENSFRGPDGESHFFTYGAAMDQALCRALFLAARGAMEALGETGEFYRRVGDALARLAPLRVGSDGRLMEWAEEYAEVDPGHRHISHLMALHPANLLSRRGTPELMAATRKSLECRLAHGGGGTGWSRAWVINFWARFGEGDRAAASLHRLFEKCTLPNLMDTHPFPGPIVTDPPFQIDGNLGAAAGIAEMLLQSHEGFVHLLPALPSEWREGSVRGLCTRGAFEVDVAWREGRCEAAEVRSQRGGVCRVRCGQPAGVALRVEGAQVRPAAIDGIWEFDTEAGKRYRLRPA